MSTDVEKLKTEAEFTRDAVQTLLDKNAAKERKAIKDKENKEKEKQKEKEEKEKEKENKEKENNQSYK